MKHARCSALALAGGALVLGGRASPVRADDITLGDVLTDAGRYFTAPLRWDQSDWLFFGGTVFAESGSDDYRWFRRLVGYAMASATAHLRVRGNQHWLSGTVSGTGPARPRRMAA